jgi:hypothetical protein
MKKWLVVAVLALVLALAFSSGVMAGPRCKGRTPRCHVPPPTPTQDYHHPPWIWWYEGNGIIGVLAW